MNTYGYVLQSPIIYTDPNGLITATWGSFGGAGAGAGTGIAVGIGAGIAVIGAGYIGWQAGSSFYERYGKDFWDWYFDEECSSEAEKEKGCAALRDSILSTCASLKGKERLKCFYAAADAYNQCMNEN